MKRAQRKGRWGVHVRRQLPEVSSYRQNHAVDARCRSWPEAVLSIAVVLAILGPVLCRGYLLRYDLVFVPDPPFGAMVWGSGTELPRAVPSELLAVVLAQLVPADIAEKVLLAGCLALACVGAARLAPVRHPMARIAAGLFYVWNPWVYGRLHLGQWAILAGYAALPWAYAWILRTVTPHPAAFAGPRRNTAVAGALPVVLGGPALVLAAVLACAPALALARRWRALCVGLVTLAGLTAPWLTALAYRGGAVSADPRGVEAFAARADTPLGVLGSVATLGGIWSRYAAPAERERLSVALVALVLAALAVWGFLQIRSRWPSAAWSGLLVGSLLGMALVVIPTWPPSERLMTAVVGQVPMVGAVRDSTRLLAPLALLQAVGIGMVVESLVALRSRALAALITLAPIAVLPGLAWGLAGQLRTVEYPAEWTAVRAVVAADPVPGKLLSLPWSSFRAYRWADNVPVLDPAPRAFRRPVLSDQDVLVGRERIHGESREADRVAAVLAAPGDPVPDLTRLGIRYVLVQTDQPGADQVQARFSRAETAAQGPTLTLLRLPAGGSSIVEQAPRTGLAVGYFVLVGTFLASLVQPTIRQRRMLLSGHFWRRDRQ